MFIDLFRNGAIMHLYKMKTSTVQAIKFDGSLEGAQEICKIIGLENTYIIRDMNITGYYVIRVSDSKEIKFDWRFLMKDNYLVIDNGTFERYTNSEFHSKYEPVTDNNITT